MPAGGWDGMYRSHLRQAASLCLWVTTEPRWICICRGDMTKSMVMKGRGKGTTLYGILVVLAWPGMLGFTPAGGAGPRAIASANLVSGDSYQSAVLTDQCCVNVHLYSCTFGIGLCGERCTGRLAH